MHDITKFGSLNSSSNLTIGTLRRDRCGDHLPGVDPTSVAGYKIRNTPHLYISQEAFPPPPSRHDLACKYPFRYRARHHSKLPHVVKFSGGRSSGLLLFTLLENRLLDWTRGDVIIFNNTSAEHPDTYRFVRQCMKAASSYGIPFFWVEFQTYEDSSRGVYTRYPSYRIVNDQPISSDNPDGFHWRGEVFEELLSWAGYVPNQFSRICTKHLKLEVTRGFLTDWLAAKPVTPRLGHHGDGSRIDPEVLHDRHLKNGGSVPKEIFKQKRDYVWQRPHVRPQQRYEDFCSRWSPFDNPILRGKTFGNKAQFGKNGVEYTALIGLRSDETHRVERVESRRGSKSDYEGENVYMPLVDMNISKHDVNAFWDLQDWDLGFPKDANLSNCVYCFLKGGANLQGVHRIMRASKDVTELDFGAMSGTPCDLAWWRRMEAKYGRNLEAEQRDTRSSINHIGFFGNSGLSYDRFESEAKLNDFADATLPCDCTE